MAFFHANAPENVAPGGELLVDRWARAKGGKGGKGEKGGEGGGG